MGAKSRTESLKHGVDDQLTDRALRALLKHHASSSSSGGGDNQKLQLLENDLDVQVQFSLARIPGNASPKPIRIEIPHPLVKVAADDDNSNLQDVEACIIVKEESKPWVQDMVSRFPNELGCIKKVLGLQSLRVKHKSFEQRRALLARFDVFFADDRILPMLTKALGGKFFEKKKQPIAVKLTRKEALPFAIQKSLSATFMFLSSGTCLTVKYVHCLL
jgi:ribosome biogenesis protein UTP30